MPLAVPSPPGGARPGGAPTDLTAVWEVITGMYRAYTAGDRLGIDAFLDPDATVFDSETPGLVRGKSELDQLRDRRPATDTSPGDTGLKAHGEVIDVFGDLAVARYWLQVEHAALPARMVRNTAVLQRGHSLWRIVHLHEDDQPDAMPDVAAETHDAPSS